MGRQEEHVSWPLWVGGASWKGWCRLRVGGLRWGMPASQSYWPTHLVGAGIQHQPPIHGWHHLNQGKQMLPAGWGAERAGSLRRCGCDLGCCRLRGQPPPPQYTVREAGWHDTIDVDVKVGVLSAAAAVWCSSASGRRRQRRWHSTGCLHGPAPPDCQCPCPLGGTFNLHHSAPVSALRPVPPPPPCAAGDGGGWGG